MRMIVGIGAGLLIFLFALFFSAWFVSDRFIAVGFAVIVAAYFYFKLVFNHAILIVPENFAYTLANRFLTESAKPEDTFSGFRTIRAQKEFQAGLQWKFFWEYPGMAVDMTRHIAIVNKQGAVYTLRNGSQCLIRYQQFYTPMPGYIVNLIRNDPDDVHQQVENRVEQFLQGYIGRLETIAFDQPTLDAIQAEWVARYKSETQLDRFERSFGIWTSDLKIIDIDEPRSAQEIKALLKAVTDMVTASKGTLTWDDAQRLILASKAGSVGVDVVKLET